MVEGQFKGIAYRGRKSVNNRLAELNDRGVLKSSFTVTDCIAVLTDQLKKELKDLFNNLHHLQIGLRSLGKIRENMKDFAESQYEWLVKELTQKRIYHNSGEQWTYEFDKFKDSRIEEILSDIELETKILRQKTINSYRSFWWDVTKILITAIVGGLIGAYIKGLFPGAP